MAIRSLGCRRATSSTELADTRFAIVLDRPPRRRPQLERWFEGNTSMPSGTVKWFNTTKGYGFIQPDGGGKDVFVHISAVERAGLRSLNEGQQLSYELKDERGKTAAVDLKPL